MGGGVVNELFVEMKWNLKIKWNWHTKIINQLGIFEGKGDQICSSLPGHFC